MGALFAAIVADNNVLDRIREDQSLFYTALQDALVGDDALMDVENLEEIDFSNLAASFASLSQIAVAYSSVIDDILTSRTWATDQDDGELVASTYAMLSNNDLDRPTLDTRFSAFAGVDASDITEVAKLVKDDRGTVIEALSAFRAGDVFVKDTRRSA